MDNHLFHKIQLKAAIVVNRDVAKPGHAAEPVGERGINQLRIGEQSEILA